MTGIAIVSDWTTQALVSILGFGLYAAVVATTLSFGYRWYSHRRLPTGTGLLLTAALTTVWLYREAVVGETLIAPEPLFDRATGAYLLGVFLAVAVAAEVGRWIGDAVARDVYDIDAIAASGPAATLLRSAGLAVPVTLPETVADIEGYDAVGAGTRERLAGREFLFPRRLGDDALTDRLEARVEADFDVDHAHASVDPDGTVDRLAVGKRPDGLSPRLPPGVVAAGVEADPSATTSPGDPVEIWRDRDGANRLVTTGTVRASETDVTTVTLDAEDAAALDHDERYRLLTRPDTADDTLELTTHVWDSDATVTAIDVGSSGRFEGEFVGWLPVEVVAIDRADGVVAFPDDSETLRQGDVVYALGAPEDLQRLSAYEPDAERAEPTA